MRKLIVKQWGSRTIKIVFDIVKFWPARKKLDEKPFVERKDQVWPC